MARKSSERLRTLLKLISMREQMAARQLAATTERLQQAQQQSRQLVQYERDYQQRYVEQAREQPVSRNFLTNYQGFFRQLETAQVQQGRAVELRETDRETARLRWIEQHARRRLLDKVRERRVADETMAAEKKVQREVDDHAQRRMRTQAPTK